MSNSVVKPRLVVCSGAKVDESQLDTNRFIRLDLEANEQRENSNVNIKITDIAKIFTSLLPPRYVDLLEIASYVYAADCAVSRGTGFGRYAYNDPWEREFKFVFPVRDYNFWKQQEVTTLLKRLLGFLSNDKIIIEFQELRQDRSFQNYLDFHGSEEHEREKPQRILMFSGGLDSLAGAVKEASSNSSLVLVSHRSVAILNRRQIDLVSYLKEKFADVDFLHVPVWVNKHYKKATRSNETTQRTRSFLYSTLGFIVASKLYVRHVRFYENGITSLNLPIAEEALRARASRTTHPISLKYFSDFYSLVLGKSFVVDNPFLYKTKREVVEIISKHNCQDLIPFSCSCARTFPKPRNQQHCGTCGQCLDRRIAIIAAGLEKYDPEIDYGKDVFLSERKAGYEKHVAAGYVRISSELKDLDAESVYRSFPEIERFSRSEQGSVSAEKICDAVIRHSKDVYSVIKEMINRNQDPWIDGKPDIEDNSLLSMIHHREHLEAIWQKLARRISEILREGVPRAFRSKKPEIEHEVNDIIESLLSSNDIRLQREFPYLIWGTKRPRPDHSLEFVRLLVEAKYVKNKSRLNKALDEIAADITQYSDNEFNILFVVYDPETCIVDNHRIAELEIKHENVKFCIIH